MKLAEGTRNDCIDVVKRNMTNLFEDIEDPFAADDFDDGSTNSLAFKKQNSNIPGVMSAAMRSKIIEGRRKSTMGEFESYFGGGGQLYEDFSNSVTPNHALQAE